MIQVIPKINIPVVFTRKIRKLAHKLRIENLSRCHVSKIINDLNEQAETFRNRSPIDAEYLVLWADTFYEKVSYAGRFVSMAMHSVCGVNVEGRREILVIEPMSEKTSLTYGSLFDNLQSHSFSGIKLSISDAHSGLVHAIDQAFPGTSRQ